MYIEPEFRKNILKDLYKNPGFPTGSIVIFSGPSDFIKPTPHDLEVSRKEFVPLDGEFNETAWREDGVPEKGCYKE